MVPEAQKEPSWIGGPTKGLGTNKYTNFVVGLGYRILEPIGMHSDARDKARKSAHCGPKDKVRWP